MRKKRLAAGALVLLLGTAPVLGVYAKSMDEAQKEKESLEDDLKEAQELIESLKGSKDDIQEDVEKLDAKLNDIEEKLKELDTQLQKKREAIADTETTLKEAEEKEKEQYASMKKRIRFMYENGTTSYIELLFSSEDFSDFLNAAEYITQISQYDRRMLEEYQNTQDMIAVTQSELEEEFGELQALEAQVQEEQQAVAALEAAKKGELADVTGDLEDAETIAKVYEAEIQAQNEIIAQIQAAQAAAQQQTAQQQQQAAQQQQEEQQADETQTGGENESTTSDNTQTASESPAGQATGSMTWPCPSSHRITSDYGPRESPTTGASSDHKGIDIGAAYGADIVAADSGKVIVATYSNSAGNYVIIDHGGGLCAVYMHASSLLVSAGQSVSKGQVIAKVGSTGYSTGNHLHFGVSVNGSYVSPWRYVG